MNIRDYVNHLDISHYVDRLLFLSVDEQEFEVEDAVLQNYGINSLSLRYYVKTSTCDILNVHVSVNYLHTKIDDYDKYKVYIDTDYDILTLLDIKDILESENIRLSKEVHKDFSDRDLIVSVKDLTSLSYSVKFMNILYNLTNLTVKTFQLELSFAVIEQLRYNDINVKRYFKNILLCLNCVKADEYIISVSMAFVIDLTYLYYILYNYLSEIANELGYQFTLLIYATSEERKRELEEHFKSMDKCDFFDSKIMVL